METWWERHAGLLQREFSALDELGLTWAKDEASFAIGILRVSVDVTVLGSKRTLQALYPDTYPYFPPQVILDGPALPRHQNLEGVLCLLSREGEDWQPARDTLAGLLQTQLPKIERSILNAEDAEAVASVEDRVGEPLSNFMPVLQGCAVIVPDQTPSIEHATGRSEFQARRTGSAPDNWQMTAALTRLTDMARRPLVESGFAIPGLNEKLRGFWIRLPGKPDVAQDRGRIGAELYALANARCPELKKAVDAAKCGELILIGFVYPDEVTWRHSKDDWLFLALTISNERRGAKEAKFWPQMVRADWGGEHAFLIRAPFLKPLREKTAVVVGVGAIGSPLAIHLARAGIKNLRLIDADHLQTGNSIRWALGWQFAGEPKVNVLVRHISCEYPRTSVSGHATRIGWPDQKDAREFNILKDLLASADVVIDAGASFQLSHFLADLAKSVRKPYIWLTATPGGAGGVVGRVVPGRTLGCWHCYQRHLGDGNIKLPADAGTSNVQPGGCAQATFVGAGIDSDEIALSAARLSIATMCSDDASGYLDFEWDVAVADLIVEHRRIAPSWTTYALPVHPACSAHAQS